MFDLALLLRTDAYMIRRLANERERNEITTELVLLCFCSIVDSETICDERCDPHDEKGDASDKKDNQSEAEWKYSDLNLNLCRSKKRKHP